MLEKYTDEYLKFLEQHKLLPIQDMAKILNMHPATLRSLAKSNNIKHIRIGKKYYFNIEDIQNTNIEKKETPDGVIVNNGYVKINVGKTFPSADANGYITLHKLIIEANNMKRLADNETIVHKDGDAFNNKIDNLEVKTKGEGK